MRIDLHAHSSASDGTDTPAQLVAAAAEAGLDVLAITDHDTTGGWEDAKAARPTGLALMLGAEFSCKYVPTTGRRINLHLLGYLFDPAAEPLRGARAMLRESRRERGRIIVERMSAAGLDISWEQVSVLAAGATVGRPHIGRALVDAGIVGTVDEAFAGPLSSRAPYYEPKADLDVFEAIAMIRTAGGLPVFAHPIATRRGPVVPDEAIAAMAAAGLVGIEVDHPDHDTHDRAHASAIAAELNLIPTGSSDYHGSNKPNWLGMCTTAPGSFEQLLAMPTAIRPAG